jgi:hypothetical protein
MITWGQFLSNGMLPHHVALEPDWNQCLGREEERSASDVSAEIRGDGLLTRSCGCQPSEHKSVSKIIRDC